MTLVVGAPATYLPERRYILDVVLVDWLGLDYALVQHERPLVAIRHGGDPTGRELTMPDVLFATPSDAWLTEAAMPARPLARIRSGDRPPFAEDEPVAAAARAGDSRPIPVVFGKLGQDGEAWERTATGLSLAVDVLGSVFYLLSRYEEVARRARDAHGRFPTTASLAMAEGFLERPIADDYVDLLWAGLHAMWPHLRRRASSFRLRLTHDVDQPRAALGQSPGAIAHALAGDLLRRRDLDLAFRRARSVLDARTGRTDRDPLNTFDLLMNTSERHGLRSVFYFMAGNVPGDVDFRYRLSEPWFIDLLRRIHDRGHEVGLHSSYASYLSAERIQAEFDALRSACRSAGFDQPSWGVRQHYLRFRNPETWRIQEAAGLDHDSSLGFAEHVGFRAGTCREYALFDILERRELRLRERPLVVMDATLFTYLGLGLADAASKARAIVDACRRHDGDAVVLYHNDVLAAMNRRRHYQELVEELVGAG